MNKQDTFLNLKLFRNVIDKKSKIKNYVINIGHQKRFLIIREYSNLNILKESDVHVY